MAKKKKKTRRKPRVKIDLMLPVELIDYLKALSEFSGVSQDDCINVILASKVMELKTQAEEETI